jgi:hypothetical protein
MRIYIYTTYINKKKKHVSYSPHGTVPYMFGRQIFDEIGEPR